jgi:hypothetical protein
MNKRLSAAQWRHLDPARKPEPESFTFPSADRDVTVISTAHNGARLVRAAA